MKMIPEKLYCKALESDNGFIKDVPYVFIHFNNGIYKIVLPSKPKTKYSKSDRYVNFLAPAVVNQSISLIVGVNLQSSSQFQLLGESRNKVEMQL